VPTRLQALERKRLQELERWREQQAGTAEEEDNANFAPVMVRARGVGKVWRAGAVTFCWGVSVDTCRACWARQNMLAKGCR